MANWYFAAPYGITCNDIGNCNARSPTIDVAFANIAQLIIGVVGGLAVIFVIVAGLQMTLSVGNPKRFAQGRQSLLYAMIGVALALTAQGVLLFVIGAFNV